MKQPQPRPGDQGGNDPAISHETPGLGAETDAETEEQPNVTPEEQKAYEEFVDNGLRLIYSDDKAETTRQALAAGSDPVQALAQTAVSIVRRLEDSAGGIDPAILLHGGEAIVEELADLAATAGIHDFSPEEMETAAYRAFDIYKESGGKAINEQAAKHDIGELDKAEKAGDLDKMFPGLAEHFGGAEDEQDGAPMEPEMAGAAPGLGG